jgi:hypothetical protein
MEDTHVYNTHGSADPDSIEALLAYLSGVFEGESAYLAKIEASFRKRGVKRIAREEWKLLAEKFRACRV